MGERHSGRGDDMNKGIEEAKHGDRDTAQGKQAVMSSGSIREAQGGGAVLVE